MYQIGEGCYATFNAKKSDGNFIYDNCTIEGNTIVYDFASSIDEDGNAQISACEGIVECEVTLYKANSEQLTSPRFTLYIDGTVYNGEEIISTPEANVLKKLINETNDLIDEVETKLENGDFKGDDYTLTEADKQEISQLATNDVKRYTDNIFGNAIKVTSSGKIISVNDVSPIEHNLDVNLTSDTITDFSNVKVSVYGTDTEGEPYNYQFANEDGTVTRLTSVSPNMTILADTSNIGDENIALSLERTLQEVFDDNKDGSYTINKSVSTDMPIMTLQPPKPRLETGQYILDLGVVTSDLYLRLNYHNTETGKEHSEQTDSTGTKTFPVDTPISVDSIHLWASKSGDINLKVTPRLYKVIDKSVYIDLTYNADTNKVIGDVETALDIIINIQNELIGGDN
jgi:hypothetical protein